MNIEEYTQVIFYVISPSLRSHSCFPFLSSSCFLSCPPSFCLFYVDISSPVYSFLPPYLSSFIPPFHSFFIPFFESPSFSLFLTHFRSPNITNKSTKSLDSIIRIFSHWKVSLKGLQIPLCLFICLSVVNCLGITQLNMCMMKMNDYITQRPLLKRIGTAF